MKHGHYRNRQRSPTYSSWAAMQNRCNHQSNMSYPSYGGRGIKVCRRWRSFIGFLEDMGERPHGTSLGRKNHDLPYSKQNCEWQSRKKQNTDRSGVRFHTYKGVRLHALDWAKRLGVKSSAMYYRLKTLGTRAALDYFHRVTERDN